MKFTGRHLIAMGYEPGPWFATALEKINQGRSGEEIAAICDALQPPPKLKLTEGFEPDYFLAPLGQDETENVLKVKEDMQELTKVPTIRKAQVMPDACPAGVIPVGGVVAAENAIHPGWHSADICCSVMATELRDMDPKRAMDLLHDRTHFGPGGRPYFEMTKELEELMLENPFTKHLVELGHHHMGTQGDGNHFASVGTNRKGNTVLVTHHGSRGLGAKVYKQGMQVAERFRRELSPETSKRSAWIPWGSKEGDDYWRALALVKMWTKENHENIQNIFHPSQFLSRIWTIHNFVFRQDGLFWHAKGATPRSTGPSLIPLNMAEPILVVDNIRTGWAPHGAGRNMSRTQFKKRGIVDDVSHLDIRFFCGEPDVSELPSAYKSANRIRDEIERFDLARVVDEIQPYGSIMAGDHEVNAPWRRR